MTSAERLRDALQDAQRTASPAAWRVIEAALRAPHRDEDAVQGALLAVFRSLAQLRSSSARGACAWLFTVMRRQAIDLERRAARERSRRAAVDVESCADTRPSSPYGTDTFAALARTLAELEEHVDALPGSRRSRHRDHARAAVGRLVFALDHHELEEALDVGPLSRAQVDAWTARGRRVVVAACDRWLAAKPGNERVEAVVEVLRETMARRADAGVPRRRKAA